MSDIKKGIRQILNNDPAYSSLLPSSYPDDFDLIESGVLDSVGLMNFVLFLEQEFNIEVNVTDLQGANFKDINAISQWIQLKLQEAHMN